jgi:uncharacterized membrane protein
MQEKDSGRTEAFSDGIFAFAMTLLVVDIKVPHPTVDAAGTDAWLLAALRDLWPSFGASILSFGTILIMWINHHGIFRHVFRVDKGVLFANGLLLLMVTLSPFTTALLAAYVTEPAARVAAAVYCGVYLVIGLTFNLLLRAVVSNASDPAIGTPAHDAVMRRIRRTHRGGTFVYLVATAVALFSPFGGLAICLSLWVVWALLRYTPEEDDAMETPPAAGSGVSPV